MTVERIAIGDDIYLWKVRDDQTQQFRTTAKAVITSHGGIALINGAQKIRWNSPTKIPPKLHFFAPHGHVLEDPTLAKIMSGDARINESLNVGDTPDYVLSKFQGKKTGETYDSIEDLLQDEKVGSWSASNAMSIVLASMPSPNSPALSPAMQDTFNRQLRQIAEGRMDMDIVTIRRRASNLLTGVRLSKVLNDLAAAGHEYIEFYCSFCRGSGPSFSATP